MAANMNRVFLMGNLTRDPELRYTPGGTPVASFGLAVNHRFKDRNGNWKDEATFVDIETWGRQAETCSQYLSKGRAALIEGRLRLAQWESKQGEKRSKLKVVAERVQFIGPPRQGGPEGRAEGSGGGRSGGGGTPSEDKGEARAELEVSEDEIPF